MMPSNVSHTSLLQIIAIRIETYERMADQAGMLSNQECKIKCSIMFHNMGIALLCMKIQFNDNLRADYQTSNSSGLAETNQFYILEYIFYEA